MDEVTEDNKEDDAPGRIVMAMEPDLKDIYQKKAMLKSRIWKVTRENDL